MRPAYAFAILILALLVAAAGLATPTFAQTAVKARSRPQLPAAAPVQPAPPAPAASAQPARLTLQGLPHRFDAAPVCRAQCTRSRLACEAVDDACAPLWTACLHRCDAA